MTCVRLRGMWCSKSSASIVSLVSFAINLVMVLGYVGVYEFVNESMYIHKYIQMPRSCQAI